MMIFITPHRALVAAAATATLLLATPAPIQAQQDLEISAELNPPVATPGQTVLYQVQASVEGNYDIQVTKAPDFGPLQVVGTSTEPSFFIRGAQATRSLRLTYRLIAPQDEGEILIKAPELAIGKQVLSPDDKTLKITAAPPPTTKDEPPQTAPPVDLSQERAFIQPVLTPKRDPYVGEQLRLQYELWVQQSRHGLQGTGFSDPPLDDFWVEEFAHNLRSPRRNERRYGVRWEVIPLRTLAIFPLRPGPARVDRIELPLVQRAFFGRQTELVAHSAPVDLDVQPLPPGAPDTFTDGNIGQWRLSTAVDSDSARVGGQILLTARVHGTGLPGNLGWPHLEENDHFRLIATEDSIEKHQTPMGIQGTRTFQFRLMPLQDGALKTPTITFSYFDPDQAQYITLEAQQFPIQIEPGELPQDDEEAPEEEQITGPLWTANLHAPFAPGALKTSRGLATPPLWLFLLPIAGLLLILLEALFGPRHRAQRAPARERRRLLKKAQAALDEAGSPPDPEVLLKTISFVLSRALNVQIGALSTAELKEALQPLQLPEELKEQTTTLVDELINKRYAPASQMTTTLLERTRALTEALINWRFSNEHRPNLARSASTALLFIAALLTSTAALPTAQAQTNYDELISQAQQAAEDEDWKTAAQAWQKLTNLEPDPTFHFNAGTAFAQIGEFGHSRLHLERAIASGAHTKEVRENLDQVIAEIRRRSPAQATFPAQNLKALGLQHLAPWALATSLWLLLIIALLRRLFPALFARRFASSLLLASLLILAISSAALSFYLHSFDQNTALGVVLKDKAPLRDAPSHHAMTQKNGTGLSAGAVFKLRQSRDGWSQIELPSGLTGWLPDEALALIQESEL